MGLITLNLNRPGEAVEYFAHLELEAVEAEYVASTWWHMMYAYSLAWLYEKEESVRYLKQAHKEGYPFFPGTFQESFELMSLHGYPPFEAFIEPKG